MAIRIVPATAERWGDFEDLFGPSGACYGCWCAYWRQTHAEARDKTAADNKALIHRRFAESPPPGLLAFDGEKCVGWVQVTPRSELPRFNGARTASRPLDAGEETDPTIWAISCFFFRKSHRGQGLSHAMVTAAVAFAREGGARLVEACPMVEAKRSGSVGLYVGSAKVFEKAGFSEVARRIPNRPLMRLSL